MSKMMIEAARALKAEDPEHAFALWAVPSETPPNEPPPSEEEASAFEFVKVYRDGACGYVSTGLRFWDMDASMAVNLACCVNEEYGLDQEEAERIVAANQARGATKH